MNRHGIGPEGGSAGEFTTGAVRRRGTLRRLMLAVLLGVASLLAPPDPARADDFNLLLQSAEARGTVPVLLTGWAVITGEESLLGSRGGGRIAITGDEFVEEMETVSSRASVTRRYENFPVLAMEMDAQALQAARAYGSDVEVWDDPVLQPMLHDSVNLVGAREAWERGYRGSGLVVAVIDDGADTRHPFLAGRTVFEGCFADECPNGQNSMSGEGAADPVGDHGTHVSGIVLGRSTDGVNGVGPDLRLLIINVFSHRTGRTRGRNILAGLDAVLTLARRYPGVIGAVNMSLGSSRHRYGHCRSGIWDRAARELGRAGVAVVVASGNSSAEDWAAPVGFPACVEGFVSVGAVTKSLEVATFSNSGPALDLLAPGVDIHSSVVTPGNGRRFASYDGTSMAAPHVAAAMALLKQRSPESSVDELVRVLQRSGQTILDTRSGVEAAVIDVGRAIERLGPAVAAAAKQPPVPKMSLASSPAPAPAEEGKGWTTITE